MSDPRKVKIVTEEEDYARTEESTSADSNPNEVSPGTGEPDTSLFTPADEKLKAIEAKLEAKEKEFDDTYSRLLRVTAEFENYKKRMAREIEDFRRYANQSLLKDMLSVVDHIEFAIQAASSKTGSDKSIVEGLSLTRKELLRILEKFNVKPIEAVGQPFNPEFHEAILREPSDQLTENTVLREMQKGYMINTRLLRPSLVVVVAPKPENTLPDPGQDMDTIQ